MKQFIARVALVVPDYDAAIALRCAWVRPAGSRRSWRGQALGPRAPERRHGETALLIARADGPQQQAAIGNQTGGRGGFFLFADDFGRDHKAMLQAEVQFLEEPRNEPYGTVAAFADPFGNRWDLLQPAA